MSEQGEMHLDDQVNKVMEFYLLRVDRILQKDTCESYYVDPIILSFQMMILIILISPYSAEKLEIPKIDLYRYQILEDLQLL